MRDALRLYSRYIGVSFRSQMQYRASFIMMSIGQFLITCIEFLGVWALFERFGGIQGWTLPEVALFYGMVNVTFAIADAISRGFDKVGFLIKSGEFDQILLRPRTTVLQLTGRELTLRRVGRFLQGMIVLLWAASSLKVTWSLARTSFVFAAVFGGVCFFYGIFVLSGTLAFWTTESLEIMNTLTYGGVQTAQYPMAIYRPWFRRFFTFVVPLACVSYFPGLAILGRPDPLGTPVVFQWMAPVVGVVFLVVTLQIWKIGVRHYRSTGS